MSHRTILLVDDEPGVLFALKYSLRRDGYKLVTANDAMSALQRLNEQRFDMVMADHLMPGMTGLELLCKAKEVQPHAVRVLLTGSPDMDVAVDAMTRGQVFRYLTKPWDDVDLRVTLSLAFADEPLTSPAAE